jgi:hypothetical protein
MFEGKPMVFISHSEMARDQLAKPFREYLESLGLHGVIVSEEPLPDRSITNPAEKVAYFLDHASMFVGLASPDEKLKGGGVRTRQNIIHEIGSALERPNLKDRVQVFRAPKVELPSNINLVHERLDPDDVRSIYSVFEDQARQWGILPKAATPAGPTEPSLPENAALEQDTNDAAAENQAVGALTDLGKIIRGEVMDDAEAISARALLAASTDLAGRRSAEPLGVHALNGLFLERGQVRPTDPEKLHLLRTVVTNIGSANAPGWYWHRGTSATELQATIIVMASADRDSAASRAAMELLAKSTISLAPGELRVIVRAALSNNDGANVSTGLDLLGRHGTRRDLQVLADQLDAHRDAKAVRGARLHIQARESPAWALQLLLEDPAHLRV